MAKYSIQDGKLYCDGELANIEFGNSDLINFIKNENLRMEQFKTGIPLDINVETTYKVSTNIKCKCGTNVYWEDEDEDEDNAIKSMIQQKRTCRKCGTKYELKEDEEHEYVAVIIK